MINRLLIACAQESDRRELRELLQDKYEIYELSETEMKEQALLKILDEQESDAYVSQQDELTGLYNQKGFFSHAKRMIQSKEPGYYVIASLDIDKFKVINDQYGIEMGDEVLRFFSKNLSNGMSQAGGICARFMADDFVCLYPKTYMDSGAIKRLHRKAENIHELGISLTVSIGRYVIEDIAVPITIMYDRAVMALTSVKGRFDQKVAIYDESMRVKLVKEQEIIREMKDALEQGQFEVWLQPQYNHVSGALIGAEALVRWHHPTKGMIPPGDFIAVFERNGFIYELDKYVWEQGCRMLRYWMDELGSNLPLSVNVSRYDVLQPDFYEVITGLVNKYHIPTDLFRMEITESAFSEATTHIINTVKRLIQGGYTLEIDDFGSGYSSLNTLKDVPAQILKLDMRFFVESNQQNRSGNIVESVVRMAKWLGMTVIAEGVEDKEQADYLRSIGCFYIQGYYYAKPMPAEEYESLFGLKECDPSLIQLTTVDTLNNNDFWNPKSMETLIFNSYVGGACIFEYHRGQTELLRTNERYMDELGNLAPEERHMSELSPIRYMDEENKFKLFNNIHNAIEKGKESTCELMLTDQAKDSPRVEYIRTTARVIANTGERYLFYCVVVNTTKEHNAIHKMLEAERKQSESARHLEIILHNVNGGVSALIIEDDGTWKFIFHNEEYYELYGYTKEQALAENLDVRMRILPEDYTGLISKVCQLKKDGIPVCIDYRVKKRDGQLANLRANASLMSMEGYGEVITAVVTDMSEKLAMQDQLRALVNNINGGVSASLVKNGKSQFIVVNQQFYQMLGYRTREEYDADLPDKYTGVHPEDRERIVKQFESSDGGKDRYTMEYRIIRKDGAIRYIRNNISVVYLFGLEEPVQLSVANDITDLRESKDNESSVLRKLEFLNELAHDLLRLPDAEKAIQIAIEKIREYFQADRGYVMELNYNKALVCNTYECCKEGVCPVKENLQHLPLTITEYWYTGFVKNHYVYIKDVDSIPDESMEFRESLKSQNINSLILSPMYREDAMIGFVGVDNPTQSETHIDQLAALADYIAILLTRRDRERD